MGSLAFLILGVLYFAAVGADIPANCMYEDVRGKWVFHIGEGGRDNTIDCSKPVDVKTMFKVELKYPNIVVDEFGNEGFWTMIYNQGFEVVVHGRKFFAFSKYVVNNDKSKVTSVCNETLVGWSHDVFGRDWSCYFGVKENPKSKKLYFISTNRDYEPWIRTENLPSSNDNENAPYKTDDELIERVNSDTNILWYAKKYERFEKMTVGEVKRLTGGKKMRYPDPAKATEEVKRRADELPEEFDWRNHESKNYVTPVRNQGGCGSCYAFASTSMNEARLKVASKNGINVVFSPQDVLDCSPYSQDCEGGFPYLIGGKFSEDYGMIEEECNPYEASRRTCDVKARHNCTKYYFTKYEYIGGFYGGCNEELMKIALVNHGPIAVGFQVYGDFHNYGGGVYHHVEAGVNYNPFFEVNHAVTIVGYGVEKNTNTKFWIVKNSWGGNWGEKGYFRIRRGSNECGIESIGVQSFPIF